MCKACERGTFTLDNCDVAVSYVCVGCSLGGERRRETVVGEGRVADKEASLEDQMLEQSGYTSHGKCTCSNYPPSQRWGIVQFDWGTLPLLVHTVLCICV